MVVLGILTPLGALFGLKLLLVNARPDDLAFVFAGNIVLSLLFEIQLRIGTHFVFMRFHGMLDYFASLPIRKYTLVVAVVIAFLILSLPAVVVTTIAGAFLLHLTLALNPMIVVVIPLCAFSMAGLGALVGVMARSEAEAESLGVLVAFATAGIAALVIPPSRLPLWVVRLGWLSPATYARSAIRQALLGPISLRFLVDVGALLLFGAITLWIVGRWLDWREQ